MMADFRNSFTVRLGTKFGKQNSDDYVFRHTLVVRLHHLVKYIVID